MVGQPPDSTPSGAARWTTPPPITKKGFHRKWCGGRGRPPRWGRQIHNSASSTAADARFADGADGILRALAGMSAGNGWFHRCEGTRNRRRLMTCRHTSSIPSLSMLAPSERVVVDVQFGVRGMVTLEHHTPDRGYRLSEITVSAGPVTPDLAGGSGSVTR